MHWIAFVSKSLAADWAPQTVRLLCPDTVPIWKWLRINAVKTESFRPVHTRALLIGADAYPTHVFFVIVCDVLCALLYRFTVPREFTGDEVFERFETLDNDWLAEKDVDPGVKDLVDAG